MAAVIEVASAISTRRSPAPSLCWWISPPPGAAPAGPWRRRWKRSPPTAPTIWRWSRSNDAAPAAAARFGIRSVPTLMLFQDGKPVAVHAGTLGEKQLGAFVDQHLQAREKRVVEQAPNRPQVKLDW